MRKLCLCALVILLCAVVAGVALASGDALIARRGVDGFDDKIDTIHQLGGALMMLGSGEGVYEYDLETGETTLYAWDEAYVEANEGVTNDQGDKTYKSVCCAFAWRGRLHALVRTYVSEVGVTNVELCVINTRDGAASIETIGKVDWEPGLFDDYFSINDCIAVGDVLCANVNMRRETLCLIPLDGSDMIITQLINAQLSAYNDKLLAVTSHYVNAPAYAFNEVDPATGASIVLARIDDAGDYLNGAAWSPVDSKVLFVQDGRLRSYDLASGDIQIIAPVPIDIQGSNGRVLDNGVYAACGYGGVVLRRVSGREASSVELVIAEQLSVGAIEEAMIDYSNQRPDIAIARVEARQVLEQLLTHSDAVDIYVLRSTDARENVLDAVLARGWAAQIDSAILEQGVMDMYPSLHERLTRDGKLIAVPLRAHAFGLGVNIGALEALGQTLDDVPTNWPDFLDYVGKFTDNEVAPIVGMGSQANFQLLLRLFEDYALEIANGRKSAYDTPELRAALDAFERLDFERMAENGADIDYKGNPFLNAYDSAGVDGNMFDDAYDFYPLRLSISADGPIYMPIQMELAIINPASANIDEAVAFLEAAWGHVDIATLAMLCPGIDQPLRDQAAYERYTSEQDQEIEKLKEKLKADQSYELKEELAWAEDVRKRMESWYWIISPASLNRYRSMDDYVVLETAGELGDMNHVNLIWQHLETGGSIDALIAEIDRKAQMKRLEGN